MGRYRERIWEMLDQTLSPIGQIQTALDFGSGDGWFARQMLDQGKVKQLQAIDVKARDNALYPTQIYDGGALPFADRSFDLIYSIDVLHHCPDPEAQLADVLRCTGRFFLLKDHTYRSMLGRLELCLLDEIGNRRFGVPSLYRYQERWAWDRIFETTGFRSRRLIHPAPCHSGILGSLTNDLQFIALWERCEDATG